MFSLIALASFAVVFINASPVAISGVPSGPPSGVPLSQPAGVPSGPPSGVPVSQPAGVPSGPPSGVPSGQPAGVPAGPPASDPAALPAVQTLCMNQLLPLCSANSFMHCMLLSACFGGMA